MAASTKVIGFLLALCLGLVHIFASRTHWVERVPHRWWVSLAGGVSVAYIFLDIFPELGSAQTEVEHGSGFLIQYLENHVYLLALVGLALFYGLEKMASRSRAQRQKQHGRDDTHPGVFWIHIISFTLYNAILGYLLREAEDHGLINCLLLFFALGLHFLVNDVSLREHHKQAYDHIGRWLLAAAIICGWVLGQAFHVNAAAIAVIWAPVAGGIILNVLKEELPAEQESHFGIFATGATIYALILLIM
ncbi:MAG: hypothetical protein HC838_00730 [Spirulinaceae cyanobacterium RM2_2_10]|nr:hypothetical protein [Spirulinaceae cyanobacterium RM2_2_10]